MTVIEGIHSQGKKKIKNDGNESRCKHDTFKTKE
jgi:hypothetical protein